ncbi:hypothetical protein Aasi_1912 [Candidatus Amoebophilus asiaticus 5a2]|uniref:Uncharacterized protein n=1 Tax=Amoebophilus asiaticus (strain 5a2) TaxID=452471 RepID=C3L486_AMOA5|nr:hypothetical protein [Candidatus Amoebophilus asiaticus]ACP21127.1 hypothetical protein Aasi_1912 [Candidatus Amoebophilus asiaticus 5a2]
MKHSYTLNWQFIVHILFISLCVQSCSGLNNLPVGIPGPTNHKQRLNEHNIHPLLVQTPIDQRGHVVTFYQEGSQLQAEVEEKNGCFSKIHTLPVYIEQGINLQEVNSKQHIHVILPKGQETGYVYVGHTGLMGGGESKDEGEEEDNENQKNEKAKSQQKNKSKGKEKLNKSKETLEKLDKGSERGKSKRVGANQHTSISSVSTAQRRIIKEIGNLGLDIYTQEIITPENMLALNDLRTIWKLLFSGVNSLKAYQDKKEDITMSITLFVNDLRALNKKNYDINDKLYLITAASEAVEYIKHILDDEFFYEGSIEDKVTLANLFYELNSGIGMDNLLLCSILKTGYPQFAEQNPQIIKKHMDGYKNARNQLNLRFGIPKNKIATIYKDTLATAYTNLTFEQETPKTRIKASERVLEVQQQNKCIRGKRIAESVPTQTPLFKFSTESLKLSNNIYKIKDPRNIPATELEELYSQLIKVEGLSLSLLVFNQCSPIQLVGNHLDFTVDNLISSYKNILGTFPKYDIYNFLKWGIIIYMKNNRTAEALIRLKAMKVFYDYFSEDAKIKFERDFKIFQANAYAACGEHDKLSQLYKEKVQAKLEKERILKENRKKSVQKFKNAQQMVQLEQPHSGPLATTKAVRKQVLNTDPSTTISEKVYQDEQQRKKEEANARAKRHQEAEEVRLQKRLENISLSKEENENFIPPSRNGELRGQLTDTIFSKNSSSVHFILPQKACKTLNKIFANNWNISRKDIENLFRVLGQTINTSTKSSHHVIEIDQETFFLVNDAGDTIDVITDSSGYMSGHLSLPNWKEKVKKYMRKKILRVLCHIGINEHNYCKHNTV